MYRNIKAGKPNIEITSLLINRFPLLVFLTSRLEVEFK